MPKLTLKKSDSAILADVKGSIYSYGANCAVTQFRLVGYIHVSSFRLATTIKATPHTLVEYQIEELIMICRKEG